MGFNVNKGDIATGNVLLEVTLPDLDQPQKYSVRRISQTTVIPIQVRAKREGASNAVMGMEVFGEVMKGIASIDGSMDFSDLVEKVAQNGDEMMEKFTTYVISLASKSTSELLNDGETIL